MRPRPHPHCPAPARQKKDDGVVSNEDAHAFNCVQRGHQNYLEQAPFLLALLLVSWPFYPLYAGAAGLVAVAARLVYFHGYASGSPAARNYAAPFFYPALLTLMGCAVAAAVQLSKKAAAY